MPNRGALLVHFLTCVWAGLVGVPLNCRYMPPQIDHAIEVSGAAVLLAHAGRSDDLAASRLAGRLARGGVWYGAGSGGAPSLEVLVRGSPRDAALLATDPSAPTSVFFT
jgi:acyl-CoA synthetase (AMP-forming)/AMP-acid ligase II